MTLNIITHSSIRKISRRDDERRKASLRRHNKFKHRGSDCADALKKTYRCLWCNGPGPLAKEVPMSDWSGLDATLDSPATRQRKLRGPYRTESPGYRQDRIAEAAKRAAGDTVLDCNGRVRLPESSGKYDAWSLTMHCGAARRRAAA